MNRKTKLLPSTRILVTRPRAQAVSLCRAIRAAGGVPLLFPVFKTIPTLGPVTQKERVRVQQADILIFTSVNAVSFFPKACLNKLRLFTPARRAIFAVGPSTQKRLEQEGLVLEAEPKPPFNSEALLELPFLQTVYRKKIGVVAGAGGRTHLAEVLQKRGAEVFTLQVYARCETEGDLLDFWKERHPEVILTTSNEILQALYDRMGDKPTLLNTPLVVTSKRAMLLAKQLGFKRVLASPFYDEERLIKMIAEYTECQTVKQKSKSLRRQR